VERPGWLLAERLDHEDARRRLFAWRAPSNTSPQPSAWVRTCWPSSVGSHDAPPAPRVRARQLLVNFRAEPASSGRLGRWSTRLLTSGLVADRVAFVTSSQPQKRTEASRCALSPAGLVGARGFEPLTSSASSMRRSLQGPLVKAPHRQNRWSDAFCPVLSPPVTAYSSRRSVNFSSTRRQLDSGSPHSSVSWKRSGPLESVRGPPACSRFELGLVTRPHPRTQQPLQMPSSSSSDLGNYSPGMATQPPKIFDPCGAENTPRASLQVLRKRPIRT